MSEDEVSETLMDPEKRIIRQITVEDGKKASRLFEELMGDNIAARKQFLKTYSEESIYNGE
jgi:DNA gyrase subunit B